MPRMSDRITIRVDAGEARELALLARAAGATSSETLRAILAERLAAERER